ncbi:unnamed protein product [Ambrosiozyma monospora]|uniref:Unnamed protein product n=1 Tax=Ambrosiozyma monospora TaxID=43982 RepID=A0ACB5UAY0_AMBMO|nr:unnamed protein product [Ambrosiozyma monospora]
MKLRSNFESEEFEKTKLVLYPVLLSAFDHNSNVFEWNDLFNNSTVGHRQSGSTSTYTYRTEVVSKEIFATSSTIEGEARSNLISTDISNLLCLCRMSLN